MNAMSADLQLSPLATETASKLLAIRNRWHVKNHPLYVEFAAGKIGLEPIGLLLAQQYHHIRRVLPSLGIEYYKAPAEFRRFMLRQLVTEDGFFEAGQGSVSSMDMCLRFCRVAGLTEDQVRITEPLTIWRARAYFYLTVSHEESFAIYIAMKSITEGQQAGINQERMLPALKKYHGFDVDHPAIQYFSSQFVADPGVGKEMVRLAATLLDSPSQQQRAVDVAETAAKYYWQAVDDIYRRAVLRQVDSILPPHLN